MMDKLHHYITVVLYCPFEYSAILSFIILVMSGTLAEHVLLLFIFQCKHLSTDQDCPK